MALASRLARTALFALAVSGYVAASAARVGSVPQQPSTTAAAKPPAAPDLRAALDTYCIACHNQRLKTAGLALDTVDAGSPHTNPEVFEKVIAQTARWLDASRGTAAAGRGDGAIDRRRGSKRTSIARGRHRRTRGRSARCIG